MVYAPMINPVETIKKKKFRYTDSHPNELSGYFQGHRNGSYVYVFLDVFGNALYVGKTMNLFNRFALHSKEQKQDDWNTKIDRIAFFDFENETDQLIAEKYLINELDAIHNIVDKKNERPTMITELPLFESLSTDEWNALNPNAAFYANKEFNRRINLKSFLDGQNPLHYFNTEIKKNYLSDDPVNYNGGIERVFRSVCTKNLTKREWMLDGTGVYTTKINLKEIYDSLTFIEFTRLINNQNIAGKNALFAVGLTGTHKGMNLNTYALLIKKLDRSTGNLIIYFNEPILKDIFSDYRFVENDGIYKLEYI